MNADGKMRLGAFFNPTGHHVASWRHPHSQADAGINFQHYVEIAQTAERAKFDMVFFADNICVREANMEALSRSAQYIANFEPITLISALAPMTEPYRPRGTASTSYNEPFHVARKFASLDHISGGRAGWNLVTSGQEAEAQELRPRQALSATASATSAPASSPQIVTGLWDSWDDDAFVARQGERAVLPSGQAASAQPQGRAFLGARSAQHPAHAAGPPGDRAGRRLRGHDRGRGRVRRGDLLRAALDRQRQEVLRRAQGQGGELRPRSRPGQGHAGPVLHRRPHRRGGEGAIRAPAVADPSDGGARNPVDGARRCRPVALLARRPDAAEPAAVEPEPEHVPDT